MPLLAPQATYPGLWDRGLRRSQGALESEQNFQAREEAIRRNTEYANQIRQRMAIAQDRAEQAALQRELADLDFQRKAWMQEQENLARLQMQREALDQRAAESTAENQLRWGLAERGLQAQEQRDWRQADIDAARAAQGFGYQQRLQADRQQAEAEEADLAYRRALEMGDIAEARRIEADYRQAQISRGQAGEAFQRQLQLGDVAEDREIARDYRQTYRDVGMEDLRTQRALELRDLTNQAELEREELEGVRRGQLMFSDADKAERARLYGAIAKVRQNPNYSDDDRAAAIRELQQKIRDIHPTQVPHDLAPTPVEDLIRQGVYWDGGDWGRGSPWVVDPKTGVPQQPRGWKPPEDATGGPKIQYQMQRDAAAEAMRREDREAANERFRQQMIARCAESYAKERVLVPVGGGEYVEGNRKYTDDQCWAMAERRFAKPGTQPQQSARERAIAAAQAGDLDAQRALDERGIPWR